MIDAKFDGKKAAVWGFDNVLYPEKDFLLQVYYLFSELISYTELVEAKPILNFMQGEFDKFGTDLLFEKTVEKFNIPVKYKANFDLLHRNARLPLKLLLFKKVLDTLQALIVDRVDIFLLIDGDPEQQLNKVKQVDWHGMQSYLKLYFTDEFGAKPSTKSFEVLLETNNFSTTDVVLIGNSTEDEQYAKIVGVDYLSLQEIL